MRKQILTEISFNSYFWLLLILNVISVKYSKQGHSNQVLIFFTERFKNLI